MARRGKKAPKWRARKVKLFNLQTKEWEYTTFYLRDDMPDPDPTKVFIAESLEHYVERLFGPGYLESITEWWDPERYRLEREQYDREIDQWWEEWKIEHGIEDNEKPEKIDYTLSPDPSITSTLYSNLSPEGKGVLFEELKKYYLDEEIDDIIESWEPD